MSGIRAAEPGIRSVGIVGLGLIGGSLARDLAARGVRVQAWDHDPAALHAAVDTGVVHSALDDSLTDVAGLDAVVIALPVTAAVDFIARNAVRLADVPLVTDVCSTKHTIVRQAARLGLAGRFIGAHPFAGDHRSGWQASRTGLFRDATIYMCPGDAVPVDLVGRLRGMWESVGAVPEIIDPVAHDRQLAWTSHLPQTTATALARALNGAGISRRLCGPGGRDMTRLADSSADIWTPIALDNAEPLCEAVAGLERELATFREALSRADEQAVRRFFELHGVERV
ncbi:MAG: prephenate dehydrogenase/arogenate dehydrogenase family protein [Gemmatimonadetes bacterium]|nr:prephenate dehydrogenase/arogenate dehydrogenase family protein [Gemmatimonadota bacterium]